MFVLAGIASLLSLVGWIWIIIIAFQDGEIIWGVVSIFCFIGAVIYGVMHIDRAKVPVGLLAGGIVLQVICQVAMQAAG